MFIYVIIIVSLFERGFYMGYSQELSRKYFYEGPNKDFPTPNAAQRQAEWQEKRRRNFWQSQGRFVSSRLIRGKNFFQVEVTYTAE